MVAAVVSEGEEVDEIDGSKYLDMSAGPTSNTWLLSEDPDDRKDGLWIWGLFEEPLYPFILLKLSFKAIPMPGADVDEISPFTCYAQLSHGTIVGPLWSPSQITHIRTH